jgi:hypothetical protein
MLDFSACLVGLAWLKPIRFMKKGGQTKMKLFVGTLAIAKDGVLLSLKTMQTEQ